MPIDAAKAMKVWNRYAYCRDNGHQDYVTKADKCERYFRGDQWDALDKAKLNAVRRPAMTINKIISTLSNIMGEQIYNRSEISFRPRGGALGDVAEVLAKVFKQISDNNQLDWKRSDMFADGVITSRGFIDVRIEFTDQMQGDVIYTNLNPKNVVIDPDAEQYDPDTWNEAFVTKWVTADDIAILYSKEDAEVLRNKVLSSSPFGYDSITDRLRDRFGNNYSPTYGGIYDESSVNRNIRLIERQHKVLDNQKHFVSSETGDMRPIPDSFDRNKIALFVDRFGFKVVKKLVNRIRWIAVADVVVLHDDWSPYKHFTPVPYFPLFRHGHTIGLVENLLDPQDVLNKVASQELHVVNTTANSGWKMRAGSLLNMSPEELEQRGAETGLVIVTQGDPEKDMVKITPNQVPSGLDRVSYKAEENIKTISGVSDSAQGFDREDVAAKAIQAKRQAGQTNLAKPLDSLVRTDYILARNTLDLVQQFYSEERLITITKDRMTGQNDQVTVNQATPEGYIVNDLTLGAYDVVISSVPQRETLEDSQFDQALAMRKEGVSIPDKTLIESSRLMNKKQILADIDAEKSSPVAQEMQQIQVAGARADVGKTEAEISQKHADAQLKEAKAGLAHKEIVAPPEQGDGGAAVAKASGELQLGKEELDHKKQVDYAKLQEDRNKNIVQEHLQAQDMAEKRASERAAAAHAAANPKTSGAPA